MVHGCTIEDEVLAVIGTRALSDVKQTFLHQGITSIAPRSFENRFKLESHIEVTGASLKSGLLTIDLARQTPQTVKQI